MVMLRVRIIIAMIIAIGISAFIMQYAKSESESEVAEVYLAPQIDVSKMAEDLKDQTNSITSSITSTLLAVQLPSIELPGNTPQIPVEPEIPTEPDGEPIPFEPEDPIVLPNEPPTSTPAFIPEETPIPATPVPQSTLPPTMPPVVTQPPKPTNTPKPTKVPKPTVATYPPINEDTRPGSNLSEIFAEVEKRACVPAALLMAIKSVETGERFKNDSSKTISIYNTYGWWKTGTGDPCYGYGYHTQIGIVPQDSVNAGAKCSSAVGNPTDIKIMGILQVSEWEQSKTRESTKKHVPGNFDRRVLFDNALIFAFATKGRVGNAPQPSCSDWPQETVKIAAEKHHGVCKYDYGTGNAGDYCKKIWDLYNSFK